MRTKETTLYAKCLFHRFTDWGKILWAIWLSLWMPLWEKFLVLQPVILTLGQSVRRFQNRIIAIEVFWQCSPDADHHRRLANSQRSGGLTNVMSLYLGLLGQEGQVWWLWEYDTEGVPRFLQWVSGTKELSLGISHQIIFISFLDAEPASEWEVKS